MNIVVDWKCVIEDIVVDKEYEINVCAFRIIN